MKEKFGGQFEVLLISVDWSYNRNLSKTEKTAESILKKTKVTSRNVFDPAGWAGVGRTFNAGGYGLILVDSDGIVRGANIRAEEARKLLRKILKPTATSKPATAPADSSDEPPSP